MDISRKRFIGDQIVTAGKSAADQRARLSPKNLPATVEAISGNFVTVSFQVQSQWTLSNKTIPIYGSQYIRQPIQKGDSGVVLSMDATVAGVSGQSEIVAQMVMQGALSSLVFLPISNQKWSAVDPDQLVMWGPNGVTLYDGGKNTLFNITSDGLTVSAKNKISFSVGGGSITIEDGKVSIEGTLYINGDEYLMHEHSNGNEGANTGPVV